MIENVYIPLYIDVKRKIFLMSPKFKYAVESIERLIIQRLDEGLEEATIDVFRIMEATGYSYTPAYSILRILEQRLESKGYTVFRRGGTLWIEK